MANLTDIHKQVNLAAAAQQGHDVGDPTHSYTQGVMDALRYVCDERPAPFDDPEHAAPVLNDFQFPQGPQDASAPADG
jgi:hypothetical protein